MTDITLRPYQREFIDTVRAEFVHLKQQHEKPAVVGVAPCGAGKTVMTGWMIREAYNRGKRSIFFVHRRELIAQTSQTFSRLEIPHGIIQGGRKTDYSLPVQIASVQTLGNRIKNLPAPDFLICDECHHILAKTYKRIIDAFPDAYLLGVTATPQRMGGVNLSDVFNSMVKSLSVDELIKLGNLTPFKYYAPKVSADTSKLRSKFGDFVEADSVRLMSDGKIIGGIIEHYRKLANDKSAICYCINVEHSEFVAKSFQQAGIVAAHCDGNTPREQRDLIVEEFRRGNIKVLCNAELFGEGFDVPGCQAVILARPTQSLTLFIQQALRPLRPDPNDPDKVAVIIDHVQNYKRHGLPNFNHDWTLEPCDDVKETPAVKECPDCGHVVPYHASICDDCGHKFKRAAREFDYTEYQGELGNVDTDVEEITDDVKIKRKPTTIEEFIVIAKQRQYKPGWAAYRAKEHAKTYEDFLHIADVCGYKRGWAYHHWQDHLAQKKMLV